MTGFSEVLIVFILFVILPAVILNGIKEIKKAQSTSSGGGLRASELKAIVREAIEEALLPLQSRMADLEDRLGDESVEALRARLDPAALADAFSTPDDADEEVAAVARRTRS